HRGVVLHARAAHLHRSAAGQRRDPPHIGDGRRGALARKELDGAQAAGQSVLRKAVSVQFGHGGRTVVRVVRTVHPQPAQVSVPAVVRSPVRNVIAGWSRCRRSRRRYSRRRCALSAVNSPAATSVLHAASSALSKALAVVSPALVKTCWKASRSLSKRSSWPWAENWAEPASRLPRVASRGGRARGPTRLRPRWVRMAPRFRGRCAFPLLLPVGVDGCLMARAPLAIGCGERCGKPGNGNRPGRP